VRGSDGRRRLNTEVLVNTARIRECLIDGGDATELHQIMAEGEYYGMQTFDQALMDLVARGEMSHAEATAVAVSPHNFRLDLNQLDGAADVLDTGLKPRT
jgi:twitching motility protein PilT